MSSKLCNCYVDIDHHLLVQYPSQADSLFNPTLLKKAVEYITYAKPIHYIPSSFVKHNHY